MTKQDLIFDWSKPEASRKDKLFSVVIVGLLFTFLMGIIELSVPSHRADSQEQGTLMRLVDEEMAKSWALEADENGPFPGRLDTVAEIGGFILTGDEGLSWWRDYEVRLRPMQEENGVDRVDITPKGKREFPRFPVIAENSPRVNPGASLPSVPVLVPYHAAALDWIPKELPSFDVRGVAGMATDSLRFLVSLREDGSIAELIPLAGEADPAHGALEVWLRSIRFKEGGGERWFGLRVDFVNRRDDESEPE